MKKCEIKKMNKIEKMKISENMKNQKIQYKLNFKKIKKIQKNVNFRKWWKFSKKSKKWKTFKKIKEKYFYKIFIFPKNIAEFYFDQKHS